MMLSLALAAAPPAPIPWMPLILCVAVAQWLVFAIISIFSEAPRQGGPRGGEILFGVSSLLLAVAWMVTFDVRTAFAKPAAPVAPASVAATRGGGSGTCASIEVGMHSSDVREKLGQPDSMEREEDIRGPGAEIWSYRGSRCAIHLLDGVVEYIE